MTHLPTATTHLEIAMNLAWTCDDACLSDDDATFTHDDASRRDDDASPNSDDACFHDDDAPANMADACSNKEDFAAEEGGVARRAGCKSLNQAYFGLRIANCGLVGVSLCKPPEFRAWI